MTRPTRRCALPPNPRLVLTVRRASLRSARRPAAHPQGVGGRSQLPHQAPAAVPGLQGQSACLTRPRARGSVTPPQLRDANGLVRVCVVDLRTVLWRTDSKMRDFHLIPKLRLAHSADKRKCAPSAARICHRERSHGSRITPMATGRIFALGTVCCCARGRVI